MAFRNYQDMTGIERLNIHERENVLRFTDDADRPLASDQFTENAGFHSTARNVDVEQRAVLLAPEDVGVAGAAARYPAVDREFDR